MVDALFLVDLFAVGAVRIDDGPVAEALFQECQVEEAVDHMNRAGGAVTHLLDAEKVMVKIVEVFRFLGTKYMLFVLRVVKGFHQPPAQRRLAARQRVELGCLIGVV